MEIKKSVKADLRKKRGLLFQIGLVVALTLVVATFNYTPKEYRIRKVAVTTGPVDVIMVPVTREIPKEKTQKIAIKAVSKIIDIIPNDSRLVQTDIDYSDFVENGLVDLTPVVKDEVIDETAIFVRAEKMPSFQNGDLNTFRAWVVKNLRYPEMALQNNIGGRVVLSFVINKQGQLTDIQVMQSPDDLLSAEAIRVLKNSPEWTPGKQRDRVVNVRYNLPLDFTVQH